MHRLFVALKPPAAMRAACLAAMADGPPGWAWQNEEQLHVTLRFIGEVDRPMAEDIAAALGTIRAPPVEMALAGAGWFDQGPRGALFVRVAPAQPLAALHAKVDRKLVSLGLEPERRAYLPHITLARRRRGAADPGDWLARHAGLEGARGEVDRLILFESRLGRHGPAYEAVAAYPLGSA